jgi:hypothetical protein
VFPPSLPFQFKLVSTIVLVTGLTFATVQQQEQKPEPEKKAAPVSLTPSARLAAAKTAYLKKTGGDNIPYDVVSSTLEGWGRFKLVDAPEKADLIIEILAREESEAAVSGTMRPNRVTGRMEQSSGSVRQTTISMIRLTAFDSKTKMPLWTATERPRTALKKIDRENNEVESAERLVSKFHDQVEPPPTAQEQATSR